MSRQSALPHSLPPRLVGIAAAAAYISVSEPKFREMVEDGRMPKPRVIDRRKAWDVRALDAAVDALPIDGGSAPDPTWDD